MAEVKLFTLADATRILGENRNLVTFLVVADQIPCTKIGRAACIDERGLEQLRAAAQEYRRKQREPEARKRRGRPRKVQPQLA